MEHELIMKVKKLHPEAKLPEKANPSDLGWDLFCVEDVLIPPANKTLVHTGIAVQLPDRVGGILKDRSSVASKQGLFIMAGVIDPNYRGEILVLLWNSTSLPVQISAGAKIAQMILMPAFQLTADLEEVRTLDATDRGDAGFGSSGG